MRLPAVAAAVLVLSLAATDELSGIRRSVG
jgi:hypothetical protein